MNRKICFIGVVVILLLVTISFSSAISSNTTNAVKKESPLYRIRTKLAICKEIGRILDNIKTKFLGERIFQIPDILSRLVRNGEDEVSYVPVQRSICCTGKAPTCYGKGTCDDGVLCEPPSVTPTKCILTCSDGITCNGVSKC